MSDCFCLLADKTRQKKVDEGKEEREDAPVNTAHTLRTLGSSPLIETDLVNIIPARRFTPNDILFVGLEFHEADGTVAFDGFAVAGGVVFGFGLYAADGRALVDFVEFLSGQCQSAP